MFAKMPPVWQTSTFLNNLVYYPDFTAEIFKTLPERSPLFTGTSLPERSLMDYNAYPAIPAGRKLGWFDFSDGQVDLSQIKETAFDTAKAYTEQTGWEKHAVWGITAEDFARLPAWEGGVTNSPDWKDIDLCLKPDSRAVDAGVVIAQVSEEYKGKAPDLGAYEAGETLPHYGPRDAANAK